jgi:FAD/FMN-containing dehydrogenase/Fe-S oxidoreductase
MSAAESVPAADPAPSHRTARRRRIAAVDAEGLQAALRKAGLAEVRFDTQARALYATDASNYREVPIGVIVPRSIEDVETAFAVCRRFGAPITSRGGGTGLAGQTCNTAVVVDHSRHLNRILELDPDRRFAWVEPGCVLDDLRSAAGEHGLTFGPDPSTHNHCTLGGMVGNNSCGVHSVMAGRTADNIEALDILTYAGDRMLVGATDDDEMADIERAGGPKAEIYRRLAALRDANAGRIRERYPAIPRRVSGYNLDELLPEKGFNVARALVGSEGTCIAALRIKCRLVPVPADRVLLVLGFEDVFAAGDAVPRVLEHDPIGLEGIDEELIRYMHLKHLREDNLQELPKGGGWLLAEFGGDSRDEAESAARSLMDVLKKDGGAPSMNLLVEASQQEKLWQVRKAGLPATAHVPGMGETHPGWEDAAVPPERVGDYLRGFRKLLAEFDYQCSLYGHFGDGCIHCRIDFDLSTHAGTQHYLRFIDRAADLVLSYGGSLSGEHGDGQARGALLDKMYGADLLRAFHEFKAIWDPDWKMNPGKVVDSEQPWQNLREGPDYNPWTAPTRMALVQDHGDFATASARCVGVGECRKHDAGTMCPSYMATGEEAYSTRGRARLLFEMTRGDIIADGWRSNAVKEALEFCLACKACKSECPVNVDMAAYKTEFMHHHYKGRLRPRAAYSMGLIRWWARLGVLAPGLANLLTGTPPLSGIAKWAGGIAPQRTIPRFANPPFATWMKHRVGSARTSRRNGRVLLWPDTFNGYFTTAPLKAAAEVLEQGGWDVEIPPRPLCCGRPLYAFGFLGLADRQWRRTLETLKPYIRDEVPIVGVEPTCVAAFKDELLEMRPNDRDARRLSDLTLHIGEFLNRNGYQPKPLEGRALVHPHCHHRAVLGVNDEAELLRRSGLEVEVLDAGCCGMAGDYGFQRTTYDVSVKAGERAFLPRVRGESDDVRLVADGFSCREQALQCTGRRLLTLPEVLASALSPGPV